jgi:hypothetical protein
MDRAMVDLCQRLEAAALSLAGPGPIKDRLCDAYSGHLADLDAGDMPLALQHDFDDMVHALHRFSALPGDDIIRASVRKLSNEDASRYATLVVRMYGMLASARQLAVMPRASRNVAPLATLLAADRQISSQTA